MNPSPVLSALRAETADIHHAIEAAARVEARLRDPADRPGLVARFLSLHLAVEAAVSPWRAGFEQAGARLEARSPLIRRGLRELGAGTATQPVAVRPLPTFGEAWGWAYVAEGSMLGGRIMRRRMISDSVPLTGLGFLDPYGEETGARWRAFLTAMDSACALGRAAPDDVVKGGRDAFGLASQLLNPAPAEFA